MYIFLLVKLGFIEKAKVELEKFESKVIRLVGVSTSKLIFKDQYYKQLSLFSKEAYKLDDTSELIRKLNHLAGKDIFIKAKDVKYDKRN